MMNRLSRSPAAWLGGAIALLAPVATALPALAQSVVPEVVWLAGSDQDLEIVSGEVLALQGDRVRLRQPDGTERIIGVTLLDRARVRVLPGSTITVALVDNSFFAQSVETGSEALRTESGRLYRDERRINATVDGTVTRGSVAEETVDSNRTSVQRETVIERRVVQPTPEPRPATARETQPAQPIRGLW